jgi:hypothetical protein
VTPTPSLPTSDTISNIQVVSDQGSDITVEFDYTYTGDLGEADQGWTTWVDAELLPNPPCTSRDVTPLPTFFCDYHGSQPRVSPGTGRVSVTTHFVWQGVAFSSYGIEVCMHAANNERATCSSIDYAKTWPG